MKRILLWFFIVMNVLVLVSNSQVAAFTQNDFDCAKNSNCFYNPADCPPGASPGDAAANGSIDITRVVNKYNLQSAMIQKLGDSQALASYKANEPPVTPASTMKLIIADVALQSGLNLDRRVSVTPDVYYDGSNDTGKSSLTLNEAMVLMLSKSSNVAANVLMKAMGGVNGFTQKAHNYSYNDTSVGGYYDPSNDGKNTSTISDEVKAMNHIFSTDGDDYQTAQNSLKESSQSDNHYGVDDIANKWAGTSQVAGNVGLFNASGGKYIIGIYYNGSVDTSSGNTIQSASADLADTLQGGVSGYSATPDMCCPPSGAGDVTSLSGRDNIEKTINFFVQEGLTPAQAAGIAANLAWETGGGTSIDPLIGGPDPYNSTQGDAWGIAEWTPPSHYTDDKKYMNDHNYPVAGSDAELLTQLKVLWGQIQGKGTIYSTNILPGLQQKDSAGDAADYFRENFERCDTSYASCSTYRINTANEFAQQYNGGSLTPGGGGGGACGGVGGIQQGTVAGAVAAARQLSNMGVSYVWGGSHGAGQIATTDPRTLRQQGMDCSSSTSWVLHQAGMFGSSATDSTGFESWGQAGRGQEMTVWANSEHVFIEFNVPGVGHYQMNTAGWNGSGPHFFSWGYPTSGFTPRHWPGT